jgi:tripartite-type tricarboxylate transporter receptor subunit TctC
VKFKANLARCALAAAGMTCAAAALAQDTYPNKPIRLVVGFAPGGPADGLARIVSQNVGPLLGQTIIVDNKPGAGGTIAAGQVAKSPSDGYTLFMASSGHAGNAAYYGKVQYDTVKSFAPVGSVASSPVVIVVNASSPYQTLADLVADARKRPGKLNFATGGGATLTNLAAELLKSEAGIDVRGIAYKGSGPALTAGMSGEVDAVFDTVSSALSLVRAGKLRALAVTSAKRSSVLPQVPTVAEQVLPRFDVTGWFGILAPAGTSPDVIAKLNGKLEQALGSAAVRQQLAGLGAEPLGGTPAQFGKLVESETARWTALIQRLNLRATE